MSEKEACVLTNFVKPQSVYFSLLLLISLNLSTSLLAKRSEH